MTEADKYRQWRKGDPGKLGWQEVSVEPPRAKTAEEKWHEEWVAAGGGIAAMQAGAAIEVPRGVLDGKPWWRKLMPEILVLSGLIAFLLVVGATLYEGIQRRAQLRAAAGPIQSPALDLCAAKIPVAYGRLVKTQGEVLHWREARGGGVEVYLVKEVSDLGSCGLRAQLPQTIPGTTWRPTAGERLTLCGLIEPAERQARMVAAWRCL